MMMLELLANIINGDKTLYNRLIIKVKKTKTNSYKC